ncbi:hypothetical protein M0208_08180 [Sphingomonas sp. SUN019]|uniref:hypothetical protein n=1 Tax=Sphingomonas sp. SUN019 TaxID=2937788 RepID=UPI0021648156|nr:hypothetical protein [Sphingomonas sp. SUN019]UVO50495.1 hypothetical protein M0208_08180 [Sphingomonas sp. SUN019]
MNRTTMIAAALLASMLPGAVSAKAKTCPPTTIFTTDLAHLDGYRVFTGPDGDSAVAPLRIDARIVPLLKTGKKLGIIDLPKEGDRAGQIVIGAADVDLALHPAPYKEMFVLLGGSFTFKTAKVSIPMKPGSVLLFEDTDAKIGHGGRIGPCGYVSLSIKPAR